MANSSKHEYAQSVLGEILNEMSGFDFDELDRSASFLELGFDSLFLIQLSQNIKTKLKVKVSFRELIEDFGSIDELVAKLAAEISDDAVPAASAPAPTPEPPPVAPESQQNPAPQAVVPPVPPPQPVAAPVAQVPMPQPPAALPPVAPAAIQNFPTFGANPIVNPAGSVDGLEAILLQQQQLMAMQLQLLQGVPVQQPVAQQPIVSTPPAPTSTPPVADAPPAATAQQATQQERSEKSKPPKTSPADAQAQQQKKIFERFGPYKPVRQAANQGLTSRQQEHLDAFIKRFTAKTAKSRTHAQNHRDHFADPRGVAGYRRIWKDMVYQISVERSKGSKLWDIDGNEYIDVAMGFGLNLFGQSPDFVTKALHEQLDKGVEVGPQSPLAGETAQLLCDFARQERATFCNTGSEAVMAAMRLARTVTGKSKFVFFNRDYHGNFDQVLIRSNVIAGRRRSSPAAPGVPQTFADNAIVFDYGTEEALQGIAERADEIAAVLVEPVQSADPFLQPKEFLREVRRITRENNIAMVMDEVITGFRAAAGGAQEWFDVWADMATYGKVLGGGMPIGALAGKAEYMDALDGGTWRYEDDSEPTADMTFFAGTFVRHPLAIAAAYQILMRLKEEGPEFQRRLAEKTSYLVDTLNRFFEEQLFPIRVAQFTSLFRFMFPPDLEYADMLYFHLLDRGIFTRGWGDNCFLCAEHSDEDVEKIITAVKESCLEIRRGGFFPDVDESMKLPADTGEKKKSSQFSLTEAQLEIWLTSQMGDEASCSYNEPFTVRFKGDLDANLLCRSMQAVVARHGSLHMKIDANGQWQAARDPQPVDIERVDLTSKASPEQDAALAEASKYFGSQPFDLVNGPLIRLRLVKLATDDHVLFFSAHHIVSDGWSTNLMLGEIREVYSAAKENRDPELPEPADYRDYVAHEVETENSEEGRAALEYWMNEFRSVPDPLELPYDRPRPAVKTYNGHTLIYKFDLDVYQSIKKVAATNKASLFAMTLSAFNVLLARLSGQNDIVVTIPTAGQTMVDNQCLVGHCVNLLPIRSQVDLSKPFTSFLSDTSGRVFDAFEHLQCTLGKIVRNLNIPRDPSRMPLVEVNFNLDRDGAGLKFDGLELEIAQTVKEASTFDIFFNLNETREGLELYLDYNRDLFDESTIRRWVEHYETLLQSIASDPSAAMDELPLLTAEQQAEILTDWNATETNYPRSKAAHQLFETQVEATPNAVAVVWGKTEFTYRQINERANQVARHLQSVGVTRQQLVGIHLERSEQMVVGVLAILKAGAAYVPLDPMFPAERLAMMAEDAELSVIVTQESLAATNIAAGADLICVDRDAKAIAEHNSRDLDELIDADQLAYVIYTSGSTGKPKGVMIPHCALTNFLCSMQAKPGISARDVLASVTTLSFDIAALEIYLPLISGATVVIVAGDDAMDGKRLPEILQENRVTIMQATPATWRLLVDSGWKGKADLKVLCGGEAMPPDLADSLLTRSKSLWNMYGPTETTIWSTVCEIQPDRSITIGRPIANTEIYVLDGKNRPVPNGVAGRLFIGGDGLATGYHKRPKLTAEKFIRHPFRSADGELVYDTGDQARFLPNGELEFLGRLDHQVKIRGFRIETDEIERALLQHAKVDRAVVVARNDIGGVASTEQSLVAYVVAEGNTPPDAAELRDLLRRTLPEYMIPAAFVFLDDLPLTPNRKVDRKALPVPQIERSQLSAEFMAPRDNIERQVANVWKKTLNVGTLGLDDNFFDAGGHSLMAARMIAEIEKIYGERLPLATLLQAPTIRQFADVIRRKDWQPTWQCLVPIQEGGSKTPLFCIHAAGGNVLLYRDLAKRLGDDQPVYGLQAKGLSDEKEIHTTVEAMATEYVAEIQNMQPHGPYHIAGYCLGGTIAYEVAQQLKAKGEEVGVLALFDTHSKWFTDKTLTWMYAGYQQVIFHTANVFKSGPRGVGAFITEKFHELRRRLARRFVVGKSVVAFKLGMRKQPPLVRLEAINDRASEEYTPRKYGGHLTVFKPCKAYLGYDDPTLGWGNGLVESVDVIELPVFPAGMLLEPFVQDLAAHLKRLLDDAAQQDAQSSEAALAEESLLAT
ncbi:MAG: amino acid adenylation domain-containing protein [Planctomycetales bacterium]|nr:amino acid adenylation domain-containing protein [Planctomycetales bacterium]